MAYDREGHPCPDCGTDTGYVRCLPCQTVKEKNR